MRVLYFGVLKESLGRESETVELSDGACVADVMARFEQEEWTRSIAVAVNREYARREDVLRDGDEVALLPPVSGGCLWRATEQGLFCGSIGATGKMRGFLDFARNDTLPAGDARKDTSFGRCI